MTDLFKQKDVKAPDVKTIRDRLLHFIKEQLGKAEGGEGGNIKGLHLFLNPVNDEKHLYEAVVYYDEEDRFKNTEVQRIADDFAIELPAGWTMDISFTDTFPEEAIKVPDINAALFIRTQKRALQKAATAYIRILNGEAENEVYTISSADARINIGRDKKVQGSDGFFRVNTIVFPATSQHESNRSVSRQHAHIKFDNNSGQFLLFADEGGIPPKNKIKVRSTNDAAPVKLYSTRNGHALQEGDQIMLGESAIIEFSYLQ